MLDFLTSPICKFQYSYCSIAGLIKQRSFFNVSVIYVYCYISSLFKNDKSTVKKYAIKNSNKWKISQMTVVYPSTLSDVPLCIQDWVYMANDHKTTCVNTSKMQMGFQRGHRECHLCGPRAEPLEAFLVLMFKDT